ncbi:DUF3017 domain-containing protein [Streptomyces sp. NBC_00335]|uniref:DUF3017 domain-containing protein n=1 Tax=unclassified Streptomyces TaxID=2593676 RepID=UPI002255020D|nr:MULTISPECIES: DUF3017 domain-containing protein [unclassified Streptomyces]MCX5405102.1 DUF3017 domain-containing protein [Streptomyces sp. NBC_00086]
MPAEREPDPAAAPEPAPAPAAAAPRPVPSWAAKGTGGGGRTPRPAAAQEPEGAKSRRFPSVTRDTARPEGGGRAAPGDAPAPARQWPMLAVLTATAGGLLLTAMDHPRAGCLLIGIAMLAGSVMRRLLPSVGMLAVRSRFTDMVTYGLLGVAITLLALVIEPKPWLNVPFLETAVRFTVR